MMFRDFVFIGIAVGVYWGLKLIYGKRDGTIANMPNKAFLWFAALIAFGLIIGTPFYGTKTPGSFLERETYDGMFYVNMFPERQDVRSFRVPARVSVGVSPYEDYRKYSIRYAIMPSGSQTTFDNPDSSLILGSIVRIRDNNGRYWGVELTSRAYSK